MTPKNAAGGISFFMNDGSICPQIATPFERAIQFPTWVRRLEAHSSRVTRNEHKTFYNDPLFSAKLNFENISMEFRVLSATIHRKGKLHVLPRRRAIRSRSSRYDVSGVDS